MAVTERCPTCGQVVKPEWISAHTAIQFLMPHYYPGTKGRTVGRGVDPARLNNRVVDKNDWNYIDALKRRRIKRTHMMKFEALCSKYHLDTTEIL